MAQGDEPSANVYAYFSALIIIALAVSWFFEELESVSYAVIIVVSFVWMLYFGFSEGVEVAQVF